MTFVNRSAERLLDWHDGRRDRRVALAVAVPEFGPLFERLRAVARETAQDEIKVSRARAAGKPAGAAGGAAQCRRAA